MILDFNPFSLDGKTVIITGASSGIGRQCAIDCSKMGARVVLIARNEERLRETLREMVGEGHIIKIADLSDIHESITDEISTEIGKIDGFIHSAGIEKTLPAKLLKKEDYLSLYNVNALSAFEFIRLLSKKRQLNNNSSIIFISSISSLIARNGLAAYAASKGAINSAVRVLAMEFVKKRIRVNAISPGTILTPLMENVLKELSEEQSRNRIEGFPLGLGKPSDISNACIYLLSDASRWITGQNLIIDGGYTVR